jgi:3'-phosphoadenosine 5'-phosphosulfate (PAPS) 3'-phosphatase
MEDESDFSSEVQIALQAVRKACVITKRLQEQIDIATITKTDSSPVTVADFASQAVVLQHLYQHFPEDLFLAEESSETLIPSVTEQIQQACGIPEEAILKECIDLGQSFFQSEERRRVWCLDPIDGTKGFLRKGQYCVALGLLENARVHVCMSQLAVRFRNGWMHFCSMQRPRLFPATDDTRVQSSDSIRIDQPKHYSRSIKS